MALRDPAGDRSSGEFIERPTHVENRRALSELTITRTMRLGACSPRYRGDLTLNLTHIKYYAGEGAFDVYDFEGASASSKALVTSLARAYVMLWLPSSKVVDVNCGTSSAISAKPQ